MTTRANEPAFPHQMTDGARKWWVDGLTKRDYFAGLAMQGFVQKNITTESGINIEELRARWSVQQADALLAELAKGDE